jgi:hypothetical protein
MLVLAMEFSKDARRPGSENELGGGRTDTREAGRLEDGRHHDGSDISLPLPQNGIVRSGIPPRPGIRGRPGTSPERDMGGRQPPGNERKPNNQ